MSITLPEDAEPFLGTEHDFDRLRGPGVYALRLTRPENLEDAWDGEFDVRPPFFGDLLTAESVVYVGAAKDVLARLEDHVDGDVRRAALLRVCDIESIRNIWWFDDTDMAFQRESKLAILLQNEFPDMFVHQR